MSKMMMVWSTKAFAVGFLEQPKDLPSEESDVRTLNDFYSPAKSNFSIAIQGTQGNDTFQIRTVLKDWHRKQKQEFLSLGSVVQSFLDWLPSSNYNSLDAKNGSIDTIRRKISEELKSINHRERDMQEWIYSLANSDRDPAKFFSNTRKDNFPGGRLNIFGNGFETFRKAYDEEILTTIDRNFNPYMNSGLGNFIDERANQVIEKLAISCIREVIQEQFFGDDRVELVDYVKTFASSIAPSDASSIELIFIGKCKNDGVPKCIVVQLIANPFALPFAYIDPKLCITPLKSPWLSYGDLLFREAEIPPLRMEDQSWQRIMNYLRLDDDKFSTLTDFLYRAEYANMEAFVLKVLRNALRNDFGLPTNSEGRLLAAIFGKYGDQDKFASSLDRISIWRG